MQVKKSPKDVGIFTFDELSILKHLFEIFVTSFKSIESFKSCAILKSERIHGTDPFLNIFCTLHAMYK